MGDNNATGDVMLDIRNLKTYFYTSRGVAKAVDDVSLTLHKGEFLGLVGESGCGKTVTALSALKLVPFPGKVVEGRVTFMGTDILSQPEKAMQHIRGRKMAMISQDPMSSLNPVWTVGDQIETAILRHNKVSRKEARDRAIEMLKLVAIPAPEKRIRNYPHELSGGMKQRIMIALALSCDPEVLIADNPTTALDTTIQMQFLHLLLELREKLNQSVLYITHDLGVVAKICENVAIMYAGKILERGDVFEVLKTPRHPYTQGLIRSAPNVGARHQNLEPIPGDLPDLLNLPPGCRFADRCPQAMPHCHEDLPVPTAWFSDKHAALCWLYGSRNAEQGGQTP